MKMTVVKNRLLSIILVLTFWDYHVKLEICLDWCFAVHKYFKHTNNIVLNYITVWSESFKIDISHKSSRFSILLRYFHSMRIVSCDSHHYTFSLLVAHIYIHTHMYNKCMIVWSDLQEITVEKEILFQCC